ncbi:MAG TPA: hypothetical protein VIH26_06540 [Anaerolineales bacterium]
MSSPKPHDWLNPLSVGVGCLFAAALFALGRAGPDFDRYLDWSRAFARGDILELRGSIVSPNNVPLTQWSHGTGLILALPQILTGETTGPGLSALVAGWLAGVVFWWAMFRLIVRAAAGNVSLTVFGMGAAFVGTHAGFYSHTYGSESVGYALGAVLAFTLVGGRPWRMREALVGGAAAALLFLLRSNLAVFALPATLVLGARAVAARRIVGPRKVILALAGLAGTSLIGILQVVLVNHWMTGDYLRSPYVFGANGFHSVELAKPQLLAVLAHPWHGLLSYHPLYAIGMAAVVAMVLRTGPRRARLGWLAIGVLVMVQLYVQASWYAWWLGTGTFGQRGMSISAVLLVPALVVVIERSSSGRRLGRNLWIVLTLLGCLWSYLLLLQGETSFYSYVDLMEAQLKELALLTRPATLLPLLGGLILPGGIIVWMLRRNRAQRPDSLRDWAAGLLGILSFSYLELELAGGLLGRVAVFGLAVFALAALVLLSNSAISRWNVERSTVLQGQESTYSVVGAGLVTTFLATAVLFARLAIRTEQRIGREEPAPRAVECSSSVQWDEVRESFYEYQDVAGFETQKAGLETFLVRSGGVECPELALP